MKPSVGRIVHFAAGSGACWAAMVLHVYEPNSDVIAEVSPPDRDSFKLHLEQDATGDVSGLGKWHWPERVE